MSDVTTVISPQERTRKLCRILSKCVSMVASPGLGMWEPAWELVEEPSALFLDALSEFERTGDEAEMDRAKRLSLAVRDAWREADRKYREAGLQDYRREVTA